MQYRLGIRPEDLHLVNDNEISNYPIQLSQFTVDLVELTGSYKLLHCHHNEHKIIAAVDSNLDFELGQTVSFGIKRKMHTFSILIQAKEYKRRFYHE